MKAVFATLLVAAIALWAAPADAKDKKNSPNLGSSAEHRQNGAHRKGERKTGAGDAAVMSEDGGKAKTDKKAKKKRGKGRPVCPAGSLSRRRTPSAACGGAFARGYPRAGREGDDSNGACLTTGGQFISLTPFFRRVPGTWARASGGWMPSATRPPPTCSLPTRGWRSTVATRVWLGGGKEGAAAPACPPKKNRRQAFLWRIRISKQ